MHLSGFRMSVWWLLKLQRNETRSLFDHRLSQYSVSDGGEVRGRGDTGEHHQLVGDRL